MAKFNNFFDARQVKDIKNLGLKVATAPLIYILIIPRLIVSDPV